MICFISSLTNILRLNCATSCIFGLILVMKLNCTVGVKICGSWELVHWDDKRVQRSQQPRVFGTTWSDESGKVQLLKVGLSSAGYWECARVSAED